jgi:hypothetical protein
VTDGSSEADLVRHVRHAARRERHEFELVLSALARVAAAEADAAWACVLARTSPEEPLEVRARHETSARDCDVAQRLALHVVMSGAVAESLSPPAGGSSHAIAVPLEPRGIGALCVGRGPTSPPFDAERLTALAGCTAMLSDVLRLQSWSAAWQSPAAPADDVIAQLVAERVTGRDRAEEPNGSVEERRQVALGRLANDATHQFGNLFCVILNYTEFLLRELEDSRVRSHLEEIQRAATNGASLNRRLFHAAREEVASLVSQS